MLRAFWGRRPSKAETSDGLYRPYTTEFDRTIRGDEIDSFLGGKSKAAFFSYSNELELTYSKWRADAELAAIEAVSVLPEPKDGLDIIASLLVDHSGSMAGQRAILAIALVQIVADLWSRLGIRYEIIGFTTQSWHGGQCRRRWRRAGRPPNPGRLCDLLYIEYKTAESTSPGAPWAIHNIGRRELLKENVDGEAIEWAASRLRTHPEPKKLIVVVSDGAPVDDSTLRANDPGYLERHLRSVLSTTEHDGISVCAIGLDEAVKDVYPKHVLVRRPLELSTLAIPFITRMLHPANARRWSLDLGLAFGELLAWPAS